MSSSISTFVSAAALTLLAALTPREAAAQACCGGPTAFAPARLASHEVALVGLQVKVSDAFGSFDAARRFARAPRGAAEVDLEQDVVAAVRVLRSAQLSMLLPMIETYRRVPGLSEAGGDLGDLQLGARWDFTLPGEHGVLPGIALLFGAVLPTGRAPDDARGPLGTDATGTGSWQLSPALAVEQTFGSLLINVTGSLSWRSARAIGDVRAQQGMGFVASATGAYVSRSQAVLALSATYLAQLDAHIGGATAPDSGRASTRIGLSGGLPFGQWRAQASIFADVPLRFFGYNQPAGAGLSITIARGFS